MGYLGDIFGDASTTLPDGITPDHDAWPDHWPKRKLDDVEFDKQWRDWQATLPDGWDQPGD